MEFIHKLLQQFTPDEKIKNFAEEEGLLSKHQEDVHDLRNISVKDFLSKPEVSEYVTQRPLDKDFSRYLALQLLLKEKGQLDSLYMELVESNQLSLKENTDFESLTGLFWAVIMEKEKAEKDGTTTTPFKLDFQKLKRFKENNLMKVNASIAEVNGFKEEIAKLQDGLATYTHQIDKLLKEKASISNNVEGLESLIVLSTEEEKANEKIVESLKWLESKIRLHQATIKGFKVFQEGGVKKFVDENGNSVPEVNVKKIKSEYRKLLEKFGEEEEKIKKISGTSMKNKLHHKKYEERITAIIENVNHLEKTRKAYQDYKVILGGKYEKALEILFQNISRGEKIDKAINYYEENRHSFESSLRKLENKVESSFVFLQEVQLERQEMERIFEACKMQEELIQYEYSSLDELFIDIENCKNDTDKALQRHKDFNHKFDAISKDFVESKVKGNLLTPEKVGFFRTILMVKLEEAKELNKQYLSYKKLHDTLLQNYKAITRSLQNNEKQYKEQFQKVSEGRDHRYNKTVELETACRIYELQKDYQKLFLASSPIDAGKLSEDLCRLEENLNKLSKNNADASRAFQELKEHQLLPFREIQVINDLLEEFDERDVVRPETIESFIEELSTLMKLDKDLGGLAIGEIEENTVSGEIIKSMNKKLADIADELAANKKDHASDVEKYQLEVNGKEREISQLKAEVDKLALIILEDHTREEKLLSALDEERKRSKELQDHVFQAEERFEDYRNSPFWKKNFVNTFSTIFFIGGLFYSIISDLPWDRMQLSRAVPFIEAPTPLHERDMFLFADKGNSDVQSYLTTNSYITPSSDRKKHLILDLHKYKISVDASSFMNIHEGDFERSDIEEIVMAEINRFCKEKNIDFEAFLEFYKGVYPNCIILTKGNIEQATNTIYALWEEYADTKYKFKTIQDKYDYSNNVLQLFAVLQLRSEDPYSAFVARLFNEYHASGYSPADAKETMLNNLASIQKQYRDFFTPTYKGVFKPNERIEKMNVNEFVTFITPYIKKRYYSFARQNRLPLSSDVDNYVHSLAEDIFYSTKMFNVPKTMAVLIAHQETFFHNMLGDRGKSEGPFQIYRPTKKIILTNMRKKNIEMPKNMKSLLHHQTFSTLMATFHISQLMSKYSRISFKNGKGYIEYDLKKCAISYNGSVKYYYEILKKQKALKGYIDKYASKEPTTRS